MATESKDSTSLKRARSTHLTQLTKMYKELEENMISKENVEMVTQLNTKLCERFGKYQKAHLECLDVQTDSDVCDSLEKNFESCKKNFQEFQDRFSQWINCIEEKTPEDDDGGSVVSRVTSVASSTASSRSKLKGAKAKRLVAEYKLKRINENIQIERAKKELELKQQRLESESELEQARIEESVWQEAVEEDTGIKPISTMDKSGDLTGNTVTEMDSIMVVPRCDNPDDNAQLHTQDYVHRTDRTSQDHAFQRLATALQEGFNLPKPELLRFSGSSMEYCKFISNFDSNIECRISDNRLRLNYLIQYCDGEAKRAIEDCVLLEPSAGYTRAREILFSRYGRPYNIARCYIDKLVNGPSIKASDTEGLSNLSLDMQKCEITLSQLGFQSDIDNTDNLRRIVKRLPMHVRGRWVDVAHSISESGREPRFSDLVKFVDEKARVAASMYGLDLARESSHGKVLETKVNKPNPVFSMYKNNVTTLATNSLGEKYMYTRKCCCCSGKCLDLASCKEFTSMSLNEREQLVRELKLCYNCLKGKHFSNTCRKPAGCTVEECKVKHHVLLHSWVNLKTDHTVIQSSVNCASTKGSVVKNCLGIIPVTVIGGNGISCQTYALLDDGADKTLCDERLLKTMNLPCRPVTFQMSTVSSTGSTIEGQEVDLHVQPVQGKDDIILRKVWSVKTLPISTKSAPSNSDFQNVPHLSDITIPQIDHSSVMLLIGTDSPEAHIPLEVRSGNHDQPYAIRTKLGWAVRGPVFSSATTDAVNINFEQSADVLLQQQLEKMWNTDFDDKRQLEKNGMSTEDKRALVSMESSIKHEEGHYKLRLPWRNENANLPNNISLAHARLEHLKRKLARDHELHKMYTATVSDYIDKGYATEVTGAEYDEKRVWYLPHHPVTNPNKPGKVRVVFDCAAKYKGVSLNSELLQGPDFMNSLVGVVIRFRQEPVALAADIEAMFHQVRVNDEDCDALRFLWWPGGDISQHPKCYRMKVHLFGATSSPSCTAYALKRTATDNSELYKPEVLSTVEKNFYVDDCLKSVSSEEKAINLASDLQSLMKNGGFRLTKWISNSRNVLDSIPESERAPSIVDLNKGGNLPVDRALGVHWDVEKDEIKFKVKLSDKPLTRRGILSIVSSIFDPLGLVSPVTLRAKAIVQNLCRQKLRWDDKIPEEDINRWQQWLETLPYLEHLSVRRCFKPTGFGNVKNAQLHIFCDGSELGYGACAYLRLTDDHDVVTCSLVIGKSRLAPIKHTSIPRLELSGAVVASRLYGILVDELEIDINQVTFWTDSMIVLGYLKNESRRFKTFVGNRISQIHELTSPAQWRHVDTNSNPADIASRGIDARDTENLNFWLNGPHFLLKSDDHWPHQSLPPEVHEDDTEVKKEITINTVTHDVNKLLNYYSDWNTLQRSIAWLLRFKTYCQQRYLKRNIDCKTGNLTVSELQSATHVILHQVQETCFSDELKELRNNRPVKKASHIASLNPILENDIICTNGRVMSSYKQPIILPNGHHVTKVIISHYHEHFGHIGTQQALSAIREKYWIIKGHATVKKVITSCFKCKRLRGTLSSQQMAPLVEEQTTADLPPFTYVGIDFFGPLTVKVGRSREKRYGCLFTCLTTRAVHLEIAHSLSTDSFISAFQRFTSRRGLPRKVFSDNGTNLVSGENELRKSIREWNQSKISRHFTQNEIEWHFNPPNASHMGGAWERLIRATKIILKSLIREQLLNDEQLLTLMTETEKILNDRPLTPVSCDPRDPLALTPNTLLLMKSNHCLPVGIFKKQDVYAKRWWKQVQYLANIFWKRWIREYLPLLQKRQKWQRKTTDLKKDDVVLVATDNVPRGQWPLARVVDVKVGRDGLARSCMVKTQFTQLVRPITKLCLLESSV